MVDRPNNDPINSKLPVPDNSSRELLVQVEARVLFGWLSIDEALPMLADIADNAENSQDELKAKYLKMVEAVQTRDKFSTSSALVKNNRRWNMQAIKSRNDLKLGFSGADWSPVVVDLNKVLAFQKTVRGPGLNERIVEVKDDNQALLDLCIPSEDPETPITWVYDSDGKGITISSFNPNFRVYEVTPGQATIPKNPDMPPIQRNAIFVTYGAPPSYLQVAFFKGRYFLRDGYHRAVSLLRAGINEVPCILINAKSLGQVYSAAGNFVTEDVIMGTHPPILNDFINDYVSAAGMITEYRKIVRVRGDEFVLPS